MGTHQSPVEQYERALEMLRSERARPVTPELAEEISEAIEFLEARRSESRER